MDKISFLNHAELAEFMGQKALDGKIVTAVLFYEDAKTLLKELACFEDVKLESIDLHNEAWNGYCKEFYVTIDYNFEVWVEEAYHEVKETGFKGYFKFGDGDDVIALIESDANSQVIKAADGCGYIAEIEIGSDDDKCDECNLICNYVDEDLKDIIAYIFKHILEE